jgi:hypothetical protein
MWPLHLAAGVIISHPLTPIRSQPVLPTRLSLLVLPTPYH